MTRKTIGGLLGGALLSVLGSSAEHAEATPTTTLACSVTRVQYDNQRVHIECADGSVNIGWGTGWTACSQGQTVDTLKVWTSMAQVASLSGKLLDINVDTHASCGRQITMVHLR